MLYRQVGCLNMPVIGLGTYGLTDVHIGNIIEFAVSYGVTFIDSAFRYKNEAIIGSAMQKKAIKRDSLIIGTKLSYRQQISNSIDEAIEQSLRNLNTDYIDLYFIHSPKSRTFIDDWHYLQKAKESGKVHELGVSNFTIEDLKELYNSNGVYPVINQIEVHLGYYPQKTIDFCKSKGISIQASCPLMRMDNRLLNNKELKRIVSKYKKTYPQIALRWLYQHDILSIPKTQSRMHLVSNIDIFNFIIDDNDMKSLDSISI